MRRASSAWPEARAKSYLKVEERSWSSRRQKRQLCAVLMLGLNDTLTRSEDSLTWGTFAKWAEELLGQYLDAESLPSAEKKNYDTLLTALQELAILDEMEDGADLDAFRAAIDQALDRAATRAGALGEGLFVGPVRIAAGTALRQSVPRGHGRGPCPRATP